MDLLELINLNSIVSVNNVDFLEKGGPVMFILLGFSIFAFAIILLKLMQFFSHALSSTNKIEEILSKLSGSNAKKLLIEIQKIKNPMARIIEVVIITKNQ